MVTRTKCYNHTAPSCTWRKLLHQTNSTFSFMHGFTLTGKRDNCYHPHKPTAKSSGAPCRQCLQTSLRGVVVLWAAFPCKHHPTSPPSHTSGCCCHRSGCALTLCHLPTSIPPAAELCLAESPPSTCENRSFSFP